MFYSFSCLFFFFFKEMKYFLYLSVAFIQIKQLVTIFDDNSRSSVPPVTSNFELNMLDLKYLVLI